MYIYCWQSAVVTKVSQLHISWCSEFILWFVLWCFQYLADIAYEGRLINEGWIGGHLEGSGIGLIKILERQFSANTEELRKISSSNLDVPTEVWRERLPDPSLERQCCSNPLSALQRHVAVLNVRYSKFYHDLCFAICRNSCTTKNLWENCRWRLIRESCKIEHNFEEEIQH
jgi:hypothetical protein